MLKFELSELMVNVIATALGELPFKHAQPVLQELQKQIDAQREPFVDNPRTGC